MDEDELRLRGVPGGEYVGRMLKNAFDQDEICVMPQSDWDYFDECAASGLDMVAWAQKTDQLRDPKAFTFSKHTWAALWKLACSRYKQKSPHAPKKEPEGYGDFLEGLETGLYDEIP